MKSGSKFKGYQQKAKGAKRCSFWSQRWLLTAVAKGTELGRLTPVDLWRDKHWCKTHTRINTPHHLLLPLHRQALVPRGWWRRWRRWIHVSTCWIRRQQRRRVVGGRRTVAVCLVGSPRITTHHARINTYNPKQRRSQNICCVQTTTTSISRNNDHASKKLLFKRNSMKVCLIGKQQLWLHWKAYGQ